MRNFIDPFVVMVVMYRSNLIGVDERFMVCGETSLCHLEMCLKHFSEKLS